MRNRTASLLALACSLALLPAAAMAAASPTPARVLVVYNQNWAHDDDGDGVNDSEEVARYYAAVRGVPAANLLAVSCSVGDSYSYGFEPSGFTAEMMNPIKARLTALGPTAIDVILFCYGVPYDVYPGGSGDAVCLDNVMMTPWYWTGTSYSWQTNPYFEGTPGFGTDLGHFDHALAKKNGTEMYLVARLDGPRGVTGALELVDQARYGDRFVAVGAGYWHGNAYVDSRFGQGGGGTPYTDAWLAADPNVRGGNYATYQSADECMAWAEHAVVAAGLPLKWENSTWSGEIGEGGAMYSDGTSAATAPDALFYGGWYNYGNYNDVWGWLPGSVACDLNSDSLADWRLRSGSGSFGPSALARGASCVSGVTSEPFLTGHPQPNVLLAYMLQGYTFAEASTLATPSIGWKDYSIGDPLYAPLRAKTAVHDTRAPTLASGSPRVTGGATADARIVSLIVDDSVEPEMAQVELDYGPTAAYGTTVSSGQGWWRRHALTATGIAAGSGWHYRLRLRDPAGNTTTTGDFSVDAGGAAAPTIASQPADRTVTAGQTATFDVAASGTALSYQWRRNGADIAGADAASYTTPATTAADSGARFSVLVSNASGSVLSASATLTVHAIVGTATASYVTTDSTTRGDWRSAYGADGYAIEADSASYPAYASVAFTDASLYTWAGSTADPRALQKAASPGDRIAACWYSGGTWSIDCVLAAGATHRVALYALDWDGAGIRSQTIQAVDGDSGAVLDTRTVTSFSGGVYLVWDLSGHVRFQVTNTSPWNAVISGMFFGGATGNRTDTVWVEDALPTGASGWSDGGDAWTWTGSDPAPFAGAVCQQSSVAPGEHQHYFLDATRTLVIAPGDSLFAYAYLDPANPPDEVELQWNDGAWEHRAYWGADLIGWGTGGTTSRRAMGALPATGQWVRLEVPASLVGLEGATLTGMAFTLSGGRAWFDHAGKAASNDVPPPPPAITAQPASATVTAGQTATFSVQASGTGTLTYQWRRNGTDIPGATGPSYTTAPVATADTGAGFAVVVSDSVASTTSATATLTVVAPVAPLPAGWTARDVGAVAGAGSATCVDGTWTVRGAGADIGGKRDSFCFAYRALDGDGQIIARVVSQTDTDGWAKAGVMIRETVDRNARNALIATTPGNGVDFQWRAQPNGQTGRIAAAQAAAPCWVKLTRIGSIITAAQSADGVTWQVIGSRTIAMAANVFIGLAVTSHQNGLLSTAVFDQVSVIAGPVGPG